VTPVYNGCPYLAQTLASVQAQTYPNVVHIVLDNASTDDTPAVIDAALGGRVPIITRRNPSTLPITDNWNEAMAMVPREARYVKLLCADDLIRADCISRLVAVAESDPYIEFVTAVDIYNDQVKPHGFDRTRAVYGGHEVILKMLRGSIQWMPAQHLFFRVRPERLNKPFDPEALPLIDADFVFRLLRHGNAGFVNAPLFYTRRHAATQTAAIGGNFCFLYSAIQRLDRYAGEHLPQEEIARIRTAIYRQILRHVLAWKAMGRSSLAKEHLGRLARIGFKPHALHYLEAVLTWPRHKYGHAMRMIRDQAITLPKVAEAEFLSDGVLPEVPIPAR
jgi:glycosyltransferase involved in cell wall biosynthesis